jgi:glycosyltransferase involved in cell wall biosynthesis
MDEIKKTFILVNSLGGGGAERQISYISQLQEIDKILCIEPTLIYDIPKNKIIFLTNTISNGKLVPKIFQVITVLYKLKKLGVNKHTHLICFLQLSTILGIVAKYLFNCKTTLSIRINPFAHAQNTDGISLSGRFFKFLLYRADSIVPNSFDTSKDLIKHFPVIKNKIQTIVNGYDVELILQKSKEVDSVFSEILMNNTCLINIGRTDKQKGQWHIIRIFNELVETNPSLKLFILGEGELFDDLVAQSELLGLKTFSFKRNDVVTSGYDIYFIGFQKNPYFFYKHAKLFLFPSIYEGLPNALIESLICGTPVISSDCKSGPKEIMLSENNLDVDITEALETKFGFLLPKFSGELILDNRELNENEIKWKNAIKYLLDNKLTHKSYAIEKYSLHSLLTNWRTFIER